MIIHNTNYMDPEPPDPEYGGAGPTLNKYIGRTYHKVKIAWRGPGAYVKSKDGWERLFGICDVEKALMKELQLVYVFEADLDTKVWDREELIFACDGLLANSTFADMSFDDDEIFLEEGKIHYFAGETCICVDTRSGVVSKIA